MNIKAIFLAWMCSREKEKFDTREKSFAEVLSRKDQRITELELANAEQRLVINELHAKYISIV